MQFEEKVKRPEAERVCMESRHASMPSKQSPVELETARATMEMKCATSSSEQSLLESEAATSLLLRNKMICLTIESKQLLFMPR
jgi:hypothetical protein